MFKDKDIKKGIISGVIASIIFLIFIQPILTFIWNAIIKFSFSTYTGYIDIVYENAALGKRNWIDFLVLTFFIYFQFILLFTFLLKFRSKLSGLVRQKKMETMSEDEKENFTAKRNASLFKTFSLIKNNSRKLIIFSYILQIAFILVVVGIIFTAYVDLQLNSSFSQRCTVLKPYIGGQQEDILQSKWASMKSRKDYEVLNQYIEGLARTKNIILPEVLLK